MPNINELIDMIYAKFNESGEKTEITLLTKKSHLRSSKKNIRLNKGSACEEILNNTFFRWEYDDESIRKELGYNNSFRASIVKCKNNNSFVLLPIHPIEGNTLEDRIKMIRHIINFFEICERKSPVKICLLTGTREEWARGDKMVQRVYREAEILKHNVLMNRSGLLEITFENAFEIEEAVKNCDILVPFNGSAGNLLARTINFMSNKFEILYIPWFTYNNCIPQGEGSFSKETKAKNHIKAAAVWCYMRNKHLQMQHASTNI